MASRQRCRGASGPPLQAADLVLLCALLLAPGPALATCPPEPDNSQCSQLGDSAALLPSARPVLTMQAQGVWNHTCKYCSDPTCATLEYGADAAGTFANLTSTDGSFDGVFRYKVSGWDAVVLLWPPGSNPAAGETTGLLTMPLGSATTPDPSRYRDVRYQVTGCNTGTSGSLQGGLPLPPIYIAERTSYSEPSSEPPPPSEEERQLPATCDPQDPAQASLTFPWSAVFTFYTC